MWMQAEWSLCILVEVGKKRSVRTGPVFVVANFRNDWKDIYEYTKLR